MMQESVVIHIYSHKNPVEIESGSSKLVVMGDPGFINESNVSDIWTQNILKICDLKKNNVSERLAGELQNTRGSFLLILVKNNEYFIAGDIIRSHPLFYGFHNDLFFITDKLDHFQKDYGSFEIDYEKLEEYISCGLVLGNRTVYKNVYGLQAGEIVKVNGNNISSVRYFKYLPVKVPRHFKNPDEFTPSFDKALLSAFSYTLEKNTHVNRWIVPLSGGHDSRLVINYLYRLGIKNVLCFTYGLENNEQARISRMLADRLGYEWYFVEYTERKWQKLHDIGLIDAYINNSFNGVSIPHLQDFLAIYELKEKNIITDNDIFIPGHSAVTARFDSSNFDFSDYNDLLRLAYFHETVASNIDVINQQALNTLNLIAETENIDRENFRPFINWQERQAKFTVNSIQAYDFFGFKCQLPFWDRLVADFWLDYPANLRSRRKVMYEAEQQGLLIDELRDIPFAGQKKESRKSTLKSKIKELIPGSVIVRLLRLTGHKARLDEAMNQIYSLKAGSVHDLLDPLDDFPASTRQYFDDYLQRLTYQVDSNLLTRLYTVRKLLNSRGK